jgi:hypothetical protein
MAVKAVKFHLFFKSLHLFTFENGKSRVDFSTFYDHN